MIGIYVLAAIVVLALIFVKKTIVIIPQSETKIIERLGRYYATLRPGIIIILIPFTITLFHYCIIMPNNILLCVTYHCK